MKEVDYVEQTLKGGYGGLYGEVVTEDCYKVQNLDFDPDIIFDVGGNVGVFTRLMLFKYPNAKIIAVEPDAENAHHFKKFTKMDNVILEQRALGYGPLYAKRGVNGAHHVFVSSEGLGYTTEICDKAPDMKLSDVKTIRLSTLINRYWEPGMKSLIKIDCEGGENSIWPDDKSMQALSQMDHIVMELHYHGAHGGIQQEVREGTEEGFKRLSETHIITHNHPYLYARKKP